MAKSTNRRRPPKAVPTRKKAKASVGAPKSPFEDALAKYYAFRAAFFCASKDETATHVLKAWADAEWQLIRTPTRNVDETRHRAAIVELMFADADRMGLPTDDRHRHMLSALVADIQKLHDTDGLTAN